MTREGAAFPVWRCSEDHVNDPLRTRCRTCHECKPCDRCGSKEEVSLSATRCWCARCVETDPALTWPDRAQTPAEVARQPRAAEYTPAVVLEPQRRAEAAEAPSRLRALAEAVPGAYLTTARWSVTGEEETTRVCLHATDGGGVVAYDNGKLAFALVAGTGKVTLTEAKRALGMHVADWKPRATRDQLGIPRKTGKKDTLR